MKLPKLFGAYLLHHRLAQSETSEVFLAQTLGEFPRVCVVKRLRPELSTLPEFEERFRQDAALLLRLIHGNVVQVLEVGAVEGQPFVSMEHIDGIDVRELVRDVPDRGELPPEVALYVCLEMCEGVSYICQRRREHVGSEGLTFSQAWPLDVMLSFEGVVKVISPGSVGALRLGQRSVSQVIRSPGYVAPEVVLKTPLDARSDVFSIGVVLWELLSGATLVSTDPERYIKGIVEGSWRAPLVTRKDIPGDILRLLNQMLDLDPDRRPLAPEAVRGQLVTALRRIAPAFGSGQMARLLLGRYATRIGVSEELTDKLVRSATTLRATFPAGAAGRTLTYGRAEASRPTPEPIELKPGDRIPGTRYRVLRQIGRGGSSEVFAAQHIDLERQAAIKILAPELATQPNAISYFRLEARICSRIGHPNIIDVFDFGELADGRFFFAMELLDGQSLGELLAATRRIPVALAIPIFRQIAKALQAAHEHGVIHRDLKPENVMIVRKDKREGFVKVLDFGVMAFTADQSADRVGTPGYMAPEQVNRERATPQTDVYALGAALYEVLCGELPYSGESIEAYHEQVCAGPPPALRSRRYGHDIHPALERVIHRALERDPETRQPSAADFEAELLRAQREAGIATAWDDLPPPEMLRGRRDGAPRHDTTEQRRQSRARRLQLGAAGAILGLLFLLVFAIAGNWDGWMTGSIEDAARPNAVPRAASPRAPGDGRSAAAPARPASDPTIARARPAGHPASVHGRPAADPTPARARPASDPVSIRAERAAPRPASGKSGRGDIPAPPLSSTREQAQRLVDQGEELLRKRHLAAAGEQFAAALATDPALARAALGLAAVAFQRARFDEAVRHAQRAIALDRQLARAHLLLGDAFHKLLRQEEALAAWRQALALDPGNAVALTRIARATSDR